MKHQTSSKRLLSSSTALSKSRIHAALQKKTIYISKTNKHQIQEKKNKQYTSFPMIFPFQPDPIQMIHRTQSGTGGFYSRPGTSSEGVSEFNSHDIHMVFPWYRYFHGFPNGFSGRSPAGAAEPPGHVPSPQPSTRRCVSSRPRHSAPLQPGPCEDHGNTMGISWKSWKILF